MGRLKIGKLSYAREAILPSGFRAAIGNTHACFDLIDSCTIQYSDDPRTACFQLLDGGLLCVLASQLERFFEALFWHVIRYSPDPLSGDVNLTPWFLIESPRLISSKWVNPPAEATKGWTRLFFDYDVELPMTAENGLTMGTFDREQFDKTIDKLAKSLSASAAGLFKVDGLSDVEASLVIVRDSTCLQKKLINDTEHIKVGVHFVFPHVVFQVGSAELWTSYVRMFEQGILSVYGTSGPVYMVVVEGHPIYANSIQFDTAVITRSDAKLRGTGMYKCETCKGEGADRHSSRCLCSGSRRVLAKSKGWYRPTRKVFMQDGVSCIEKMKMGHQALESCMLDELRMIYFEEYRPSCITPQYRPISSEPGAAWEPVHKTSFRSSALQILPFPTSKKALFVDPEHATRKRKPLRSNQVFSKRQGQSFAAHERTKGSLRVLEQAAASFELSFKSYLIEAGSASRVGAPSRFLKIRVRPFAVSPGGEKRLTLVNPSFHFKDAATLSLHVAHGLLKDRSLRGIKISQDLEQAMHPLVSRRVMALLNHFFNRYTVEPVYMSFRTYCRLCPSKALNALSGGGSPPGAPAPAPTSAPPASPAALLVRHKFMSLYTTAQRTAYKEMTGAGTDGAPPLLDFIERTRQVFKGLLLKPESKRYLGGDEAKVAQMGNDALSVDSFQHASNTVRVKLAPRVRLRTPDLAEWVAAPAMQQGAADDPPLTELEGVDLVFECWSDKCKSCWGRRACDSLHKIPFSDVKLAKDIFFDGARKGGGRLGARLESLDPSTLLKIGPRELWKLVREALVQISRDTLQKAQQKKSGALRVSC